MDSAETAAAALADAERRSGLSAKGLSAGSVGLLGAMVIGISCIAPAYTLTAALGPTVAEVGFQVPGIILVGFIPMLLVALGYRELNNAMPDSGTSFTWATRAFGPWIGWMAGWGLIVATVLVLSNLAGIAVDFLYLADRADHRQPGHRRPGLQPVHQHRRLSAVHGRGAAHLVPRHADHQGCSTAWSASSCSCWSVRRRRDRPASRRAARFDAEPRRARVVQPVRGGLVLAPSSPGVSLSIFIFWGWDVTLTMNEETKDPETTPGPGRHPHRRHHLRAVPARRRSRLLMFAGMGTGEFGLGNEDIQANVFFRLAGPMLGPVRDLGVARGADELGSIAAVDLRLVRPARCWRWATTGPSRRGSPSVSPRSSRRATRRSSRPSWPRPSTPSCAFISEDVLVGHHHHARHDDLLLLRHDRVRLRLVLPQAVVRLGAQLLLHAPVPARRRHHPRRAVRDHARSTAWTPTTAAARTSAGSAWSSSSASACSPSGVVLMIVMRARHPAFFRGESLRRGTSTDPAPTESDAPR